MPTKIEWNNIPTKERVVSSIRLPTKHTVKVSQIAWADTASGLSGVFRGARSFKHRIAVQNVKNNKRIVFEYTGSLRKYNMGEYLLTRKDLREAFSYFISEADSYYEYGVENPSKAKAGDFDDLMNTYSIDTVREARKINTSMKRVYDKLVALFDGEVADYDFSMISMSLNK